MAERMIAGVDVGGLPDELVEALRLADAWEKPDDVAVLTEVIDAHREADNFAQRLFGNADPGPGEDPAEYHARIERLWDDWMAHHPEWLGERARREPGWLNTAIALAKLRMGLAAADEVLAHADEPDFMERMTAAQPFIRDATAAMARLAQDRAAIAAELARPTSITCPRCGTTSGNPNDIREGYCGRCHDWTRDTATGFEFMGNGRERVYGVCRAESGPYACTLDKDHPPPHRAGVVEWEDKVPLRRRIMDKLRRH